MLHFRRQVMHYVFHIICILRDTSIPTIHILPLRIHSIQILLESLSVKVPSPLRLPRIYFLSFLQELMTLAPWTLAVWDWAALPFL